MAPEQPNDRGNLPALHDPEILWGSLAVSAPEPAILERNRVISAARTHPAYAAFDMLRTRLVQALSDRGWTRVAVTAPTRGCGSSFVAANLAVSVARLEATRNVLLDLDLRAPSLHRTFGITPQSSMSDYLGGAIAPEDFLVRAFDNLAFGLNGAPASNASELFQDTMTTDVLDELQDLLCPNLMLFDLPPALENDDVLAILPNVDAVLIVAGGGQSTAEEITKVEQMLGEVKPVLGVLLNRADGKLSL